MSDLIKMSKDGEERLVHPVNIRAYQRQGWKLVHPTPEPIPQPEIMAEEPAAEDSVPVAPVEDAPAAEVVTEEEPKKAPTRRSRKKSG